jgi:hypothetical protein
MAALGYEHATEVVEYNPSESLEPFGITVSIQTDTEKQGESQSHCSAVG